MRIRVRRTGGENRIDVFQVPAVENQWTVMDVLDYIALNLDPSLGYYRHSVCNQGVCGRCAVKVNGRAVLACTSKIQGEDLLLEPINGKVIRDLIVEP